MFEDFKRSVLLLNKKLDLLEVDLFNGWPKINGNGIVILNASKDITIINCKATNTGAGVWCDG